MVRTIPQPAPELANAPRVIRDISARVQGYDFRTILDVGANIGQSCLPLAEALPRARIYAFEPAARSFVTLQANIAEHPGIGLRQPGRHERRPGERRLQPPGQLRREPEPGVEVGVPEDHDDPMPGLPARPEPLPYQ